MPSLKKSFFRITMLSVLVIFCASCNRTSKQAATAKPTHAFGGEEWLSWTSAERSRYVDGYLSGYQSGFGESCDAAERHDLFDNRLSPTPEEKEHVINVPHYRCNQYRKEYSKTKFTLEKGIDVSPYPEIVTEMYKKYPDSCSAPYFLLMTLLSDGRATTADELYKAQINQWPNARIE